MLDLLFVELDFERAAAGNDDDAFGVLGGLVKQEPPSDVDGDIADPDDSNAAVGREVTCYMRLQLVVVVDKVFGSIDAEGVLPGKAKAFGALSAGGKDDSGGMEGFEFSEGDVVGGADLDVSEIVNIGKSECLLELLAQAGFHLGFGGVDAVLSEASGPDIAVKDERFVACEGNLTGSEHASRSCSHDEDTFHCCTPETARSLTTRTRVRGIHSPWINYRSRWGKAVLDQCLEARNAGRNDWGCHESGWDASSFPRSQKRGLGHPRSC